MVVSNKEINQKIERLLTFMEHAAIDGNWFKVKQADKKMQLLLNTLQTKPLLGSRQAQHNALESRYKSIINLIAEQQSVIKAKMQRHQENKEGIAAYKEFERDNL